MTTRSSTYRAPDRHRAASQALARSRVWQCARCRKLTGTHDPEPPPKSCTECANPDFEWMEDRRRNAR